jgi:sulfur-oxidizing protein SoxY
MQAKRRLLLQGGLAAGTVGLVVGAGLLTPRSAMAAWPKGAFEAKTVDDALSGLAESNPSNSDDITIKAPEIAENGAVVPVTISTTIAGANSISLLAANNPSPLTARFELTDASEGYVATRIKMGKTSDVIAVVNAGGKVYTTKQEIKVTIGGCGG